MSLGVVEFSVMSLWMVSGGKFVEEESREEAMIWAWGSKSKPTRVCSSGCLCTTAEACPAAPRVPST